MSHEHIYILAAKTIFYNNANLKNILNNLLFKTKISQFSSLESCYFQNNMDLSLLFIWIYYYYII